MTPSAAASPMATISVLVCRSFMLALTTFMGTTPSTVQSSKLADS